MSDPHPKRSIQLSAYWRSFLLIKNILGDRNAHLAKPKVPLGKR